MSVKYYDTKSGLERKFRDRFRGKLIWPSYNLKVDEEYFGDWDSVHIRRVMRDKEDKKIPIYAIYKSVKLQYFADSDEEKEQKSESTEDGDTGDMDTRVLHTIVHDKELR